jgi:hypothetical protein
LTIEQKENIIPTKPTRTLMSQSAAPNPQADADRLEAATDEAIAACGGDARQAVTALIVANEFLEAQVRELQPPFLMAMRAASLNPCRPTSRTGTIE